MSDIYLAVAGKTPETNTFWKAKARQTLRRYRDRFIPVSAGRYVINRQIDLALTA